MKMNITGSRVILLAVTVVTVGTALLLNFTEVLTLQAVTLNGEPIRDWETRYGLSAKRKVTDQPLDSLARALLEQDGVVKVDIDVTAGGTMNIRTNSFEPVCFVVDQSTGRMKGLNAQGRVVVLSRPELDWEHPVLTNVVARKLYDFCEDPRVRVVVPQLVRFRDDNVDFYRLIEEIDFESDDFLLVAISGLNYRLKVSAAGLYDQINEFITFLEQYETDLSNTDILDLRLGNMIIQAGEKK
jgi:hypothetical protein